MEMSLNEVLPWDIVLMILEHLTIHECVLLLRVGLLRLSGSAHRDSFFHLRLGLIPRDFGLPVLPVLPTSSVPWTPLRQIAFFYRYGPPVFRLMLFFNPHVSREEATTAVVAATNQSPGYVTWCLLSFGHPLFRASDPRNQKGEVFRGPFQTVQEAATKLLDLEPRLSVEIDQLAYEVLDSSEDGCRIQ